jgi:hypothetical protein
MQNWWNSGIHEKCLSTYCFLVKCDIPSHLDLLLQPMKWQTIIHEMLQQIPLISNKREKSYFDAIDAKLKNYELLRYAFPLLELAIWKSTILKRFGQSLNREMKMQCRTDSLLLVTKIVPFVLPFLTDEDEGSNVVNRDYDNEDADEHDDGHSEGECNLTRRSQRRLN